MAEKLMKFNKREKEAIREAVNFYLYQSPHGGSIVGLRSGDPYYEEMKSVISKLCDYGGGDQ